MMSSLRVIGGGRPANDPRQQAGAGRTDGHPAAANFLDALGSATKSLDAPQAAANSQVRPAGRAPHSALPPSAVEALRPVEQSTELDQSARAGDADPREPALPFSVEPETPTGPDLAAPQSSASA